MKQLDRLLFEQGGDCFFCKQPLAKADASIEHLLAQANGGTSAEENVVACCKAINALLGNKPLKEKLAIILRQKHGFQCPAKAAVSESSSVQLTKATLQRTLAKGPAPAAPSTTVKAQVAKAAPVSSAGIIALETPRVALKTPAKASASIPCPTCRSEVPCAVGQVDYVCPYCRGAFRY